MFDRNLFKAEDLDQIRASLNNVKLIGEQKKIVENLLSVALRYINLDELTLQGFFMLAIQNWQKKRMIPIGELRTMIPQARKNMVWEIVQEAENLLMGVLQNENDRDLLKQATSEMYQMYLKEFSNREIIADPKYE